MRVQPPILVPCFAKQIRVVVHNAPSMDHDSGTWRAKYRNLNFVSKSELIESSFSWPDLTLHCVSSHFVPCVCFELFVFHACVAGVCACGS